jgi:hypothetical protein
MRLTRALVAAWLTAAMLAGCNTRPPKAGPPPLRVSYRKSKLPAQGMVAGINNPSEQAIKVAVVFVQGKFEQEERSYRLDQDIKPLDTLSVGWAELGGCKLQKGDRLHIRCEGYADDLACEVPE